MPIPTTDQISALVQHAAEAPHPSVWADFACNTLRAMLLPSSRERKPFAQFFLKQMGAYRQRIDGLHDLAAEVMKAYALPPCAPLSSATNSPTTPAASDGAAFPVVHGRRGMQMP